MWDDDREELDRARRERLYEAIQREAPFAGLGRNPELPEAGILIGWIVVGEWQGTDGGRWLSYIHGGSDGRTIPRWQAGGYVHEFLYGDWPEDSD